MAEHYLSLGLDFLCNYSVLLITALFHPFDEVRSAVTSSFCCGMLLTPDCRKINILNSIIFRKNQGKINLRSDGSVDLTCTGTKPESSSLTGRCYPL